MTANGRPRGATTTPAAPFTSAGRTYGPRCAKLIARAATASAPRTSCVGPLTAAVGAHHDVRVEHRDEPFEVAVAGGGEEGVDHAALLGEVGVGSRGLAAHPPPRAAGELAGGVR